MPGFVKQFEIRLVFFLGILVLFVFSFTAVFSAERTLKIATTTSLQDSGLLEVLLPEFTLQTSIAVKVIARGTGAAIRDGRDGNVDMLFVHARELEEQFVREGYGIERLPIMYNDFVIAGPADDPAAIHGLSDCLTVMKKLADTPVIEFISRGDESGTHFLEKKLWKDSGVSMPADRYISIGQGMGRTLLMAFEKQAYVLTDRATLLSFQQTGNKKEQLVVLFEGDAILRNEYAVIAVNQKKFAHVDAEAADKLIKWLKSPTAQNMIGNFKISGQQVFFTDFVKQE